MRVRVIGIIVVALTVLVWGFCFVTQPVRGNTGGAVVVLDRADGIREGTSVTYLGVDLGVVHRLTIHEGRVVADLRFRRDDAQLRQGDSVRVRLLGLLGDKVLDFVPGPRPARLLGPNDTLFAEQPPDIPPEAIIEAFLRTQRRDSGQVIAPPP
jgi:ABC-type transporter Mla subunit MlaD